ncbi:hypothetical protein BGZ49_009511 [Haplosporangium sp. Z 27]|nr:hypothetical protein BGZ49_009511 [Haplosporangium sp. Z 27]
MTTAPLRRRAGPPRGRSSQAVPERTPFRQEMYKLPSSRLGESDTSCNQRQALSVDPTDNGTSSDDGSTYFEEEALFQQLEREQSILQRHRDSEQPWYTGWWSLGGWSTESKERNSCQPQAMFGNPAYFGHTNPRRKSSKWEILHPGYVSWWFLSIMLGKAFKMNRLSISVLSLRLLFLLFFIGSILFGFTIYAARSVNHKYWIHKASEGGTTIIEYPIIVDAGNPWSSMSSKPRISWTSRFLDTIRLPFFSSFSHWVPWSKEQSTLDNDRIRPSEERIHSIKELETRIHWIQNTIQGLDDSNELLRKDLHSKLDTMSQRVLGVERKLRDVDDDVTSTKRYIAGGKWIDMILKALDEEIPKYSAIAQDPQTGHVQVPEPLWNRARELLVTPDESSSKPRLWETIGQNKWMDFLNENERALHRIIDERVTIISRREFLKLVNIEANAIWKSIEKRVIDLLERDGAFKKTESTFDPFSNQGSTRLPEVEKQVIADLIDEALSRYSAGVIVKPDYALFSAGGRIIPRLTSPDYQPPEKPTSWGLSYLFPSLHSSFEYRAVKAIQPDMHAGECWPMDGTHGRIGIRLARRIVVTEVTIEHADPRVVFDSRSAPREMEIWRLVAPLDLSQQHSREFDDDDRLDREDVGGETNGNRRRRSPIMGTWWKEGSSMPGAALLTIIEYKIQENTSNQQQQPRGNRVPTSEDSGGKPALKRKQPAIAQTFSIPLSKQNVPAFGVVVKINSNWGHPDYTCLYRVRVHGHEP